MCGTWVLVCKNFDTIKHIEVLFLDISFFPPLFSETFSSYTWGESHYLASSFKTVI